MPPFETIMYHAWQVTGFVLVGSLIVSLIITQGVPENDNP